MPFRKRVPSSDNGDLGNVSMDALMLAASAATFGDDRNLDAAISLLEERGGFDARQLNNDDTFLFGQLLKRRYDATGSLNDLQWGLNYMRRGVEGTPRSARNRGPRLEELAESLLQAVQQIGPGEADELVTSHLDYARDWLRESLALADSDRHPTCRSSLGLALVFRVRYLEDGEALSHALTELRGACDEATLPVIAAACYGNYANGLMTAYQCDQSEKTLSDAIAAFREARARSPENSADRMAHTRNLISALEESGEYEEAETLRHEFRRQRPQA
jgi:tetratricopeptide (TPR) repeat protein